MSIADIRTAMADVLTTIPNLRGQPYVRDQILPLEAQVDRQDVEYDLVFGGTADTYRFTVKLFAQRDSERSSQIALDEFCDGSGSTSVKAALENSANWPDDLVDYCRVRRASPVTEAVVGETKYLMVEFEVEVVT